MKLSLKLVYDKWNGDEPYINCCDMLGYDEFRKDVDFLHFYERFFYSQLGYDKNSFNVTQHHIKNVDNNGSYYYFVKLDIDLNISFKRINFTFSNEVIEKLRSHKNFYVVFVTEHECGDILDFKLLSEYCDYIGVDENQIIILNNNSKLSTFKEKYGYKFQTYKLDLLSITSSSIFSSFNPNFVTEKKGKFFLCHNKTSKPHRYLMLSLLRKHKVLDNVNWSLVTNSTFSFVDYGFLSDIISIKSYYEIIDDFKYFSKIEYKESDFEIGKKWFINKNIVFDRSEFPELSQTANESGGLMLPEQLYTFENSYFNIVTESNYLDSNDAIQITEKTIRPFAFYQFPIIVATHNHIKYAKDEFGFDFFDDMIDHSYDSEPNSDKRYRMIIEEIVRINNNNDEFIKFYKNNRHRFEKNREIVKNLPNNDSDWLFFRSLMS